MPTTTNRKKKKDDIIYKRSDAVKSNSITKPEAVSHADILQSVERIQNTEERKKKDNYW